MGKEDTFTDLIHRHRLFIADDVQNRFDVLVGRVDREDER
jgi:hypothetical protein